MCEWTDFNKTSNTAFVHNRLEDFRSITNFTITDFRIRANQAVLPDDTFSFNE
ncbi:Uncharacterised protein [Chlamydia trachomatis]|nr:Uncharacterised protein [Chlamydia trachomatis]